MGCRRASQSRERNGLGDDVQIAKLNEGMHPVKVETVGRIEKLTQAAAADLETAGKARHEAERETAKLTKDTAALLEGVRGHVESLGGRKKELETVEERLRVLQNGVGDAEGRMNALMSKDKHVDLLSHRNRCVRQALRNAGHAGRRSQPEAADARWVGRRSRSSRISPRRPSGRWTRFVRAVTTSMRCARHAGLHKVHGAVKLADCPARPRGARRLRPEDDRLLRANTGIEGKLDAIAAKLKLVEEGTEKATRLHESVAGLDAHIASVSAPAVRREVEAHQHAAHDDG